MIKLILFAVVGLLVGIGGGSAVSVMNAKKVYAAEVSRRASIVADSIAKAEEEGAKHVAATADHPDSTSAHDSVATDAQVADAGAAHGPAAPTTHTPRPVVAKPSSGYNRAVQTVESNGAPGTVPKTVTRPTPPAKPVATATSAPGAAKVAKIFAAMPAKDAATVLEQLDDAEVQSVISTLNEKQAAAILRNMPPERAALISKAVLRSALVKP